MSHTVSCTLNKPPFIKQLTDSTMFSIKLFEASKDRKTGEKVYTNYDAVLFAKTQAAIEFYTNATAEGSFVVITCDKLQSKVSDCGKYVNNSMENARLENAKYSSSAAPQQGFAPQQQAPMQQQQQAPQQGLAQQQAAPQQQQAPAKVWSSQPQQQQQPQQAQGFVQQPNAQAFDPNAPDDSIPF